MPNIYCHAVSADISGSGCVFLPLKRHSLRGLSNLSSGGQLSSMIMQASEGKGGSNGSTLGFVTTCAQMNDTRDPKMVLQGIDKQGCRPVNLQRR